MKKTTSEGDIYIWRGFRHDWRREVLGFKTPHRISKLASYVSGGDTPSFHFGQAAGVDGNFMQPVGYYAGIRGEGVAATQARAVFSWTDALDDAAYPQAKSDLEDVISIDLAGTPLEGCSTLVAVLGGFRLKSACDPGKQPADNPCNSNGMWPFHLSMSVGRCERDGATLRVPARAKIYRAWTPHLGGLPPFEIKPLNNRLDFELELMITILGATGEHLHVTHGPTLSAQASARGEGISISSTIEGAAGHYPRAISALTSFGFEFVRTGARAKNGHLGRYISNLRFNVEDQAYDAASGVLTVDHHAQTWIPISVVGTDARYQMSSVLLQLGSEVEASGNREAHGQLCFNSTEQAPFFSRWCKCGESGKGPEQSEDAVALEF